MSTLTGFVSHLDGISMRLVKESLSASKDESGRLPKLGSRAHLPLSGIVKPVRFSSEKRIGVQYTVPSGSPEEENPCR